MDKQTENTVPAVLTVRELATILRIGINSAYRLVREGTIKSTRVGRQYRILRRNLEDYLSQASEACA